MKQPKQGTQDKKGSKTLEFFREFEDQKAARQSSQVAVCSNRIVEALTYSNQNSIVIPG
jgi:hypothetical protein